MVLAKEMQKNSAFFDISEHAKNSFSVFLPIFLSSFASSFPFLPLAFPRLSASFTK